MCAGFVEDTDAALAVTECNQPLAQELYPHRRAVWLGELGRQQRRDPIPPDEMSHWRVRAGSAEKVVLLARGHVAASLASRLTVLPRKGQRRAEDAQLKGRTGLPSRKPLMSSTASAK